jgi:hypothetical protein
VVLRQGGDATILLWPLEARDVLQASGVAAGVGGGDGGGDSFGE